MAKQEEKLTRTPRWTPTPRYLASRMLLQVLAIPQRMAVEEIQALGPPGCIVTVKKRLKVIEQVGKLASRFEARLENLIAKQQAKLEA